jgi:hypothetical protein
MDGSQQQGLPRRRVPAWQALALMVPAGRETNGPSRFSFQINFFSPPLSRDQLS